MKARLRLPDKYAGMNGIETEHALFLESEMAIQGERRVVSWHYEAVKFRLADGTWYTPDFHVLRATGQVEIQEVKAERRPTKKQRARGIKKSTGGWKDDARVKFKVAADIYDEYQWVAVEKMLDGSWLETRAEDLFRRKASRG